MQVLGFKLSLIAIGAALGAPAAWFLGGYAAIIFVIALGAGYEIWRKISPTTTLTLGDSQSFAVGGILAVIAVLVFK